MKIAILAAGKSSRIYKEIKKSSTTIIFVNTRAQAELVFNKLWHENEDNYKIAIHHGSLEKEIRRKVENLMSHGELDCVVATSSLDLGIEVDKRNTLV